MRRALATIALLSVACTTSAPTNDVGAACTSDAQCAASLRCTFATDGGCGAKGACTDETVPPGAGLCTAPYVACGCAGQDVMVPSCWGDRSPVPVARRGACVADAGAIDLLPDAGDAAGIDP